MRNKLLILFACLLTVISSVNAQNLTLKVGHYKKLSLTAGTDYSTQSQDKLISAWHSDNDNITVSDMGLSGTAPSCWVKAISPGMTRVTCTYQVLYFNVNHLRYEATSIMQKSWYITVVDGTTSEDDGEDNMEDMTVAFVHPELHLWITADNTTGEATIANSAMDPSAVDGNSIVIPYDDNFVQDKTNYWKNLVIPDTIRYAGYTYIITALGSKAFNRTTAVETISLPESVRSIGDMAFNWCVNLRSITMSDKVRYIGSNAFTYCRELEFIDLPDSLESLGDGALADCKKLKEITIPRKCKSIGNDAFMWCRKLHKLIIEDSEDPLSLGYNYNLSCDYDAKFYGGEPGYRGPFSDSAIDTLYFGRDINLPELPNRVLSPFLSSGANGFYDGNPSQYVSSPGGIYLMGIGDNVTKIPSNLLGGKAFLNEIVLPPHLEEIGYRAFYKALNQKEITIPETVTKIGEMAFYNVGTMYRYEVGRDNYDLECWPLRNVYCKSKLPPSTEDSPFGDCTVYVPAGSGMAYREVWEGKIVDPDDGIVSINVRTPGSLYSRLLAQDLQVGDVYRLKLKGTPNDDDWKIVNSMTHLYDWDLSEANITKFPKDFFWDRTNLISLKLPESLTEICDSAFYGCSFLNRTFICPSNCNSIGKHAFANTSISDILFSNPINIGEGAFMDCYNLGSVRIPSESTVGMNAFFNSGLKEIVIEDGVKTIESLDCCKIVFEGMVDSIGSMSATEMYVPDMLTWLKLPVQSAPHLYINGEEVSNITIPTEIQNIKEGAFVGCKSLSSVVLPNGVKEIGEDAFSGCTNLQSINFPSSITSIGDGAFLNCKSLTEIALPSKLTSIGASVFSGCTGINAISYPTDLQTIDSYAFTGCTSLTKVKLPSQLLKIGAGAFSNCLELTEVDIPESIVSIENRAFRGCPKINSIVAHWNDPITITEEVFPEVSSDCYLYIPIGTSTKYFNAGWNFLPKLKEAGILAIKAGEGGSVNCYESSVENTLVDIFFTPYKTFSVVFVPKEDYVIQRVKLNGVIITAEIEDGTLIIEEPEDNMELSVTFALRDIKMGDVNGDGVVNENDVTGVVNHILKKKGDTFYKFSADVNEDDIINVTDAIILIKRYIKKHN